LGARVDVGAGAKILGKIRIGDRVQIGANAVVLQDLPAGAIAVGIPARIISMVGVEAEADSGA
jgi:serine acetyltransferase